MVSPAYKACPTFVSSLQATCQLSRSCTTLTSSNGFSVCFSLSMPSCLFPLRFFHSLPLFLLLTLSFAGFPIADEVILISKRQRGRLPLDNCPPVRSRRKTASGLRQSGCPVWESHFHQ